MGCCSNHVVTVSCFLVQLELYKSARTRLGLEESSRGEAVLEYVSGLEGLTPTQLQGFMAVLMTKYDSKRQDPGALLPGTGREALKSTTQDGMKHRHTSEPWELCQVLCD